MKTIVLAEALDLSEAQFDTDNRILRDVILIRSGKSLNKRNYPEAVLQSAVSVFEGSRAFDSHAKGERRVGELTGYYQNVRYENGTLKADRHFLPTTAGKDVMAVVEAIKNGAPRTLAGLSINAVGTGKVQKIDGEDILNVESITSANSVDDVVSPAAGGTYLTASTGDELANAYIAALTFEEWFEARPEYVKRVQGEMKAVRQDDAVKAAKAEADQRQAALEIAQDTVTGLTEQNTKLLADIEAVRRELVLEKTLNKVQLPASWKVSLREQLTKADPQEWEGIVEREIEKSKMGAKRIEVTGAGQQVAESITEAIKPTRVTPNWDVILSSPENFRAWKAQL